MNVRLTCFEVDGVTVLCCPSMVLLNLDSLLPGSRPESLIDCFPDNSRAAARDRNYEVHIALLLQNLKLGTGCKGRDHCTKRSVCKKKRAETCREAFYTHYVTKQELFEIRQQTANFLCP